MSEPRFVGACMECSEILRGHTCEADFDPERQEYFLRFRLTIGEDIYGCTLFVCASEIDGLKTTALGERVVRIGTSNLPGEVHACKGTSR